MQRLVPPASEPIVPFVDRIRQLRDVLGVSTVLVMGGSGDYLDVADHVIHMDAYVPHDVTAAARTIAENLRERLHEEHAPVTAVVGRRPLLRSIDARAGRREKLAARSRGLIQVGREMIDVGALEQLTETAQTRGVADALAWMRRHAGDAEVGDGTLAALLAAYESTLAAGGMDAIMGWAAPDRAVARRYEVAAALNRYRGLRTRRRG
jgi:predicted ABC-class ATPase